MKEKIKEWKRNCPKCGEEILYLTKSNKNKAEKQNTNCKSCATKGKNNPMYGKCGKNNPNFGLKRPKETKQKMSKNNARYFKGRTRSTEVREKISKSQTGKTRSEETRKRMRLSRIKEIEEKCGQIQPNYNPDAIPIILQKAKEFGIDDLQHAENDGEFQVCGYFVDGYSPSKNVVIEYYEKAHERKKEHDERRKHEIIKELGCEFIEMRE